MLNFKGLNSQLLVIADKVIPEWLPQGKLKGAEWVCGDLDGNSGRSTSVNVHTGAWADFADGQEVLRGGDLVSLYAAIHNLGQEQAARDLVKQYDLTVEKQPQWAIAPTEDLGPAPDDASPPNATNGAGSWVYYDEKGQRVGYVFRHDEYDEDGVLHKTYSQWAWNTAKGKWVPKSPAKPRKLYNLPNLMAYPDRDVLLVEGEKAADAAQKMLGDRAIAVTWPGGSNAVKNVDWSPLSKRRVTIWPDADEPGVQAANRVRDILASMRAECRIIDVSGVEKRGWDAHDALTEGWDFNALNDWTKKHIIEVRLSDGSEAPSTATQIERWNHLQLQLNDKGKPIHNSDNVARTIAGMPGIFPTLWYDTFKHCKMVDKGLGQEAFTDADAREFHATFQRPEIGMPTLGWSEFYRGVELYAYRNKRNYTLEQIKGYELGGVLLEDFFIHAGGAEDNNYTRIATKNFWIAMIARIAKPGSKVDNMLILEGNQGIGKGKLLAAIGGDGYVNIGFSRFDKKEMAVVMAGRFLAEMGELTQFAKADIEELKAWLTCTTDRVNRKYDREASDLPRTAVVVGTTNSRDYLYDPSGARRFIPMWLGGTIDLDYVHEHREAYFAEAYRRYCTGETWWEYPEEAVLEQRKRFAADEWDEVIEKFAEEQPDGFKLLDLAAFLGITVDKLDWHKQRRITSRLRFLGFTVKTTRVEGRTQKQWKRLDSIQRLSG